MQRARCQTCLSLVLLLAQHSLILPPESRGNCREGNEVKAAPGPRPQQWPPHYLSSLGSLCLASAVGSRPGPAQYQLGRDGVLWLTMHRYHSRSPCLVTLGWAGPGKPGDGALSATLLCGQHCGLGPIACQAWLPPCASLAANCQAMCPLRVSLPPNPGMD